MTIYGICESCHNHLHVHSKVDSRTALFNEIGTQSKINCKRCGVTTTFNANDLKAKFPKKISQTIIESTLTLFVIGILSYFLTTNMIYITTTLAICTIPAFIYILYIHKKRAKVLSFNKKNI